MITAFIITIIGNSLSKQQVDCRDGEMLAQKDEFVHRKRYYRTKRVDNNKEHRGLGKVEV